MKKQYKRSKLVLIIAFTIIISIAMFIVIDTADSGDGFFSTMEEAFRAHPSGSRDFGTIMFIDEHECNLTVYHGRHVTTFIVEQRDNERWYLARIVTVGGILINPPSSYSGLEVSAEALLNMRTEEGFFGTGNRNLREDLNRFPLYGISHDNKIYSLSINGISVEHVVLLSEGVMFPMIDYPVNLYFWYFSDFPPITGATENIIISFGE